MPIRLPAMRHPFTWTALSTHDDLASVEAEITDEHIRRYAFAADDVDPWYLADSPFGGRIGHPLLLVDDILKLTVLTYELDPAAPGGIHTRGEFELVEPVRSGEHVSIRGWNTAREVRKGRRYRHFGGEVRGRSGAVLLRASAVTDMGPSEAGDVGDAVPAVREPPIATAAPPGAPLASRAADAVVGSRLPDLAKRPSLEQSIVFSGFPFAWAEGGATEMRRSFHTDRERARALGFPDVMVQGVLSAAYLSEACKKFFGAAWLRGGRLAVTYRRPVFVRDRLIVGGLVTGAEPSAGGVRLSVDLWITNEAGEAAVLGRASATVSGGGGWT